MSNNPDPIERVRRVEGTIQACDGCCTERALAEMWVLLGALSIALLKDETSAHEAFQKAIECDRTVQPPKMYTTPRALQMFEEIRQSSR